AGKSSKAKKTTEAVEPPPMLVHEQERLTAEKKTLIASIATNETEATALRARFDADKKRWVELKSGVIAKPTNDPKGPTTVTLSAGAAGRAKCGDKVYECPAGETYIC